MRLKTLVALPLAAFATAASAADLSLHGKNGAVAQGSYTIGQADPGTIAMYALDLTRNFTVDAMERSRSESDQQRLVAHKDDYKILDIRYHTNAYPFPAHVEIMSPGLRGDDSNFTIQAGAPIILKVYQSGTMFGDFLDHVTLKKPLAKSAIMSCIKRYIHIHSKGEETYKCLGGTKFGFGKYRNF